MVSVDGRQLFPLEYPGAGLLAQVVTVRRAEDSSKFVAGFVNVQVPPAAQFCAARCLGRDGSDCELGGAADGSGLPLDGG